MVRLGQVQVLEVRPTEGCQSAVGTGEGSPHQEVGTPVQLVGSLLLEEGRVGIRAAWRVVPM